MDSYHHWLSVEEFRNRFGKEYLKKGVIDEREPDRELEFFGMVFAVVMFILTIQEYGFDLNLAVANSTIISSIVLYLSRRNKRYLSILGVSAALLICEILERYRY